jgi:uncharacterized iron-regulated membrane protein
MFRFSRKLHKWISVFACLFLVLISGTGLFLGLKSKLAWVRPPTMEGTAVETEADIISIDAAMESAFTAGYAELAEPGDVDRMEYRPKDNLFKVTSKDGYREVQVDAGTGEVLSTGQRNDQLMEDLHDLSFFGDALHDWILPVVAVGLFVLGVTGIVMFWTPVFRRWKFKKEQSSG